jgi:hypothetical protein
MPNKAVQSHFQVLIGTLPSENVSQSTQLMRTTTKPNVVVRRVIAKR